MIEKKENWMANGKMRHEKIMSYKMEARMRFGTTYHDTDRQWKFLCEQKIPCKSFIGRWKSTLGYLVQNINILEKLLETQFIFMYVQKKTKIVPILKTTKSTYHKNLY